MMWNLFFLFWQASGHRTSQNHVLRHHRQNRPYHHLIFHQSWIHQFFRGKRCLHSPADGMDVDAGEVGEGSEPMTIDRVDEVSGKDLRRKKGMRG